MTVFEFSNVDWMRQLPNRSKGKKHLVELEVPHNKATRLYRVLGGHHRCIEINWWTNNNLHMMWCPIPIMFRSTLVHSVRRGFFPPSVVAFLDEICDALRHHALCNTFVIPFYAKILKFPCFNIQFLKVASYHCMVYVTCYYTSTLNKYHIQISLCLLLLKLFF